MTTEQRLERAERQIRWMKSAGVLGIGVLAVVFLVAQGTEKGPDDIEARSLKLIDKEGGVLLSLVGGEVPTLTMRLNDDDKTTVRLSPIGLWMSARSKGAAVLSVTPSPNLSFADAQEELRVNLTLGAGEQPGLRIRDQQGRIRAVLGVFQAINRPATRATTPESTLTLLDGQEEVIWRAPR